MALAHTGHGRHDLARRAIAALESIVIDKSLLHGMQAVILRQALDGRDGAPDGGRQGETGKYPPAIHQHGAGAALTMIAAFLAAGQVQMLPQCVKQGGTGIQRQSVAFAINIQGDRYSAARGGRGRGFGRGHGASHSECFQYGASRHVRNEPCSHMPGLQKRLKSNNRPASLWLRRLSKELHVFSRHRI